EHRIPEAHGRIDHGCPLTSLMDGAASAPISDVARERLVRAPISDVARERPKTIASYLNHLGTERRLSPHTATNYARDLNSLADFMDRGKLTDWRAIDSQHVRVFAARA